MNTDDEWSAAQDRFFDYQDKQNAKEWEEMVEKSGRTEEEMKDIERFYRGGQKTRWDGEELSQTWGTGSDSVEKTTRFGVSYDENRPDPEEMDVDRDGKRRLEESQSPRVKKKRRKS